MSQVNAAGVGGGTQGGANPWMPGMPPEFAAIFDPTGVMAAWQAEFADMQRKMAAMPKVLEAAQNAKKGCTPYSVVMSEGPVRLLRYESKVEKKHATPVLFVFALVNRPYVLDLLPHKSVVRQFLNAGYDVWMIDWGVPDQSDAKKTLNDYVNGHMRRMIGRMIELTGQPKVNLVGYCMGGTLSAMFTSLHQEMVKNLVLMAAPVDWSTDKSLLMCWTNPKYFDVDKVVDALGLIPPNYLGTSFALLKPVANYFQKWVGFYEKMDDEKFLEDFFAMETWSNDNIPIAGEVYRDFVKYGFQQNLLLKGEFPVGGAKINLGNITCPVLSLTADADHLVLPEQSTPLKGAVSSTDYTERGIKAGHIGLSVGSKAHKELWPWVCEWMGKRSDGLRRA